MMPFAYQRPSGALAAVAAVHRHHEERRAELPTSPGQGARYLAGGTNLIDLMKAGVMRPELLVDVRRLQLDEIAPTATGGLSLGAMATNAQTAQHPEVRQRYPLLRSAILAGASPQIRNRATNGGNLLQRTRCVYFYDIQVPCNKRVPGSGCSAAQGFARQHAILGASNSCVATHPSDFCVALAALDAEVHVVSPEGERVISFANFHRLPEDHPEVDTTLERDELLTRITLPPNRFESHSTYLKIRERSSYAFALVSVAAALQLDASGIIVQARLALGGVAHKPWRDPAVEALLEGRPAETRVFEEAAQLMLQAAQPCGGPGTPETTPGNAFKIPMARRAIVRALEMALHGVPTNTGEDAFSAEAA